MPNNPNTPDDAPEEFYPQEEMEVEQPRRAASAEFVVQGQAGSSANMREAMDPANQSLADALRLSYRVLQAVMIVLIALFLVSGFQSIEDDQSGVMLRFGRIVEVNGEKSLEPGLQQSWLPYPAGEFVLFPVSNLTVNIGDVYWPEIRPGETFEQAKARASDGDTINPSKTSGSVLARGGDIAHLQLSAKYEILDPAKFVVHLQPGTGDVAVVRLALQSATVRSVAETPLESLIQLEQQNEIKDRILRRAQEMLNDLDTGIQLREISLTRVQAALAIVKAFEEVQQARVQAQVQVQSALTARNETLISTAGEAWPKLLGMIDEYKTTLAQGDEAAAEQVLASLNDEMQHGQLVGGQVSEIIRRAESYEAEIDSTLGKDARRYESLVKLYEQNPQLTVMEQWQRTMSTIFSVDDAERIYVPHGLGLVRLNVNALDEVAQLRRRTARQKSEQMNMQRAIGSRSPYIAQEGDVTPGQAGRQLRTEGGKPVGTANTSP